MEEAKALGEANEKAAISIQKRKEASQGFKQIQGAVSPVAAVDSSFSTQMEQLNQYVALYPQKISEVEAVRAQIEDQYRQKRMAAMWEEWAQQNAATQAAAAAFDSLGSVASNALTGIVTGSMSASDAMRSIGMTVLNSVINSFVQMGVEWVKSAIMGQTATTAAVAASTTAQAAGIATTTATSTAAAAATTAAWTPAAIMSSIASFGGAVAIGIGAMAGILALSGKRKNGGPVSAGGMYQVGEGGMPEIYQASTGKQYMIPGDNGKVISNKDMAAGGGVSVIINVQNMTSATFDAQATNNGDGTITVDAIIADLNNGGPISQAITGNTTAKRTPRGQL
ncbi:Tail protein (Tape measure) [Escherichia coli]